MLEAIISGSAANNYSERELWAVGSCSGLTGSGKLASHHRSAGSAAPPKNQAFQPKAPSQRWERCGTQNRVFQQHSTTSLIVGPGPLRASGPAVVGRRR